MGIAKMTYNGQISKLLSNYPYPKSKCADHESLQKALGLKPHDLSGALLLLGCCIVVAILWQVGQTYANRAEAKVLTKVEACGEKADDKVKNCFVEVSPAEADEKK